MSITRSVPRHRWFRALVALLVVGATLGAVDGAPAGAQPQPARAPGADPITRIASLTDLVTQRQASVDDAYARQQATIADLGRARLAQDAALARAAQLDAEAKDARRRYQAARDEAGKVAAATYMSSGNETPFSGIIDAQDATEYGYRQKLNEAAGDAQFTAVRRALRIRRTADRLAAQAERQKYRYRDLVARLAREIPVRDREYEAAQSAVSSAKFWLTRWQSIAAGVDTPIMSRSILSPSEIARYFEGSRRRARITVPMSELTRAYIEEGDALGVRGDIAFAQSILETGGFYFPDGGQLTPTDNNLAGINACDSCASGTPFPDARTGVRAQLQLLRVYADPNFSSAALNPPAVLSNLDSHFLKGEVPTWNGLTHTWATADEYGDRILQIYAQMLAWLTDRAEI